MPSKRINRGVVLGITLAILLFLFFVCSLVFGLKMQPYEILTKKFYIPIKEEYEIVHFENVKGDISEKYCEAELKIAASEYHIFQSELEKAGYSIQTLSDYDVYLENSSDWIDCEKVVQVYEKATVERYFIYADRTHMHIFITESIDGYYHVYMSRD